MALSMLITLIYVKTFFMVILVFLFFYNLITDKEKYWGTFFMIIFLIFMTGMYEDQLYDNMMHGQLYEDQYNDPEREQYEKVYGENYDSSKDSNNMYDCADFDTHAEAQKVFERDGGPNIDVHHLDRDGDGIACEWLP
ncbi:excalibur calcium-binding domain-containing protein [Candidatus Woesearchaeota archaeon]|jgi:hypothetical protein|nr:excalibur calcium-binding domain-containing protein [Candidatus Woesearchaeota archaeon]